MLKGGKLFALQRHLGHESLERVKMYAHFTDQSAEEEKRKYSPADDVVIEPQRSKRRGFRTLKTLREQGKRYGKAIGAVHADSPKVLIQEADILLDGLAEVRAFFRSLVEQE